MHHRTRSASRAARGIGFCRALGRLGAVACSAVVLAIAGSPAGLAFAAEAPPAPAAAAAPEAAAAEAAAAADPGLVIGDAAAAERAVEAAAEAPPSGALSPDTIATKAPPKGFIWSVLRDVMVDEISDTYLYVKSSKKAQSSRAVPIPKDRAVLATCIAGGTIDDLVRGATITVKFDSKGEVKPEIVIQEKVVVEVLKNAKVLDRGGNKLYIVTEDGQSRGFSIEGDATAWNGVVEGGDASGLLMGAKVTVTYDPSGREALKIRIDEPSPKALTGKVSGGGGCGCDARGGATPSAGSLAFALAMLALLLRRRRA